MKKLLLITLALPLQAFAQATGTPPTFITSTNIPTIFFNTFGFPISGIATFISTDLIRTFMGLIAIITKGFIQWIIIMFVFSGIVYLAYKAFTFYKH